MNNEVVIVAFSRTPIGSFGGCLSTTSATKLGAYAIEGAINSPQADLKIFREEEGGVEHCQVDNFKLAIEYMTDWVADVFNTKKCDLK